MIRVMRNLTVGLFEHLEIITPMDVYKRIKYTHIILRGTALKKYKHVLVGCKEHIREMNELEKYLSPPLMKGGEFEQAYWNSHRKVFNEDVIRVTTKDKLPKSMQDELEDKNEDYSPIPHEELCYLMSTIKVKENKKIDADQIMRLTTSKLEPINSDRVNSIGVTRNNKVLTGVLPSQKNHGGNTPKNHESQRY